MSHKGNVYQCTIKGPLTKVQLQWTCLPGSSPEVPLDTILASPWTPSKKVKWEKGEKLFPHLTNQGPFLSKAKSDLKKQQHDVSWSSSRISEIPAKKQETVSQMFERQEMCQPSSTRLLETGMGSFWMIGTTCCHYQLRLRELTWYAWLFYPVPERQCFSMAQGSYSLFNTAN